MFDLDSNLYIIHINEWHHFLKLLINIHIFHNTIFLNYYLIFIFFSVFLYLQSLTLINNTIKIITGTVVEVLHLEQPPVLVEIAAIMKC